MVTSGTRSAVAARLGRLAEEAIHGLRAAAVLGREFDIAVLALMTQTAELDCVRWLGDAERAGIVERVASDAYQFVHAIFRDAIEEALDGDERVRLHRDAAAAIETYYGARLDVHVFDLARHWTEAAPGVIEPSPRTGWSGPAPGPWISSPMKMRPACTGTRCESVGVISTTSADGDSSSGWRGRPTAPARWESVWMRVWRRPPPLGSRDGSTSWPRRRW